MDQQFGFFKTNNWHRIYASVWRKFGGEGRETKS